MWYKEVNFEVMYCSNFNLQIARPEVGFIQFSFLRLRVIFTPVFFSHGCVCVHFVRIIVNWLRLVNILIEIMQLESVVVCWSNTNMAAQWAVFSLRDTSS
jgi:hypothetical protein